MRRSGGPRRPWRVAGMLALLGGLVVALPVGAAPGSPTGESAPTFAQFLREVRTLDGRGNNQKVPAAGAAGTPYLRIAKSAYPDGVGAIMDGPSPRFISNRIFNDLGQNLFSENNASEWVWIWGQFVDHDIGFRDETPGENAPIPFDANDPLERFVNDLGIIDFHRTPAAPGTGTTSPREHLNQITSFIDASQIYGTSPIRLDWLRAGPVDGDPTNNSAKLVLPNGFLPRPGDRGEQIAAPLMDLNGPLAGHPELARVAGDTRANENTPLTLTQTLFAREHNRLVGQLPASLPEELKFQIARRVVGAEMQFITYTEFLPSVGVVLPGYRGYDPAVDPALANEFTSVAYRSHSMVHGELDPPFAAGDFSQEQLTAFRRQGIGIASANGTNILEIPLNAAFGNPDLLGQVGIGRLAKEFADSRQYRNDEMFDESMRSVLFQIPKPGARDPKLCGKPAPLPDCFSVVQDLAAIDIERGRDHGIPHYNDVRKAYGLPPKESFADITGENTDQFPNDAQLNPDQTINDQHILDFVQLRDTNSKLIQPSSTEAQEQAVTGIRRTTLASRLHAIYGSVDNLDAFVGMQSEPHPIGAELGELQRTMWVDQFRRLRDGDRFFFANDPLLPIIERQFGITFRRTLAQVIQLNTGVRTQQANVFRVPLPAPRR